MTGDRPPTWRHRRGDENHLLPRHGEPYTMYEWLVHRVIKLLACLPVYVVLVTTLTLVVKFIL